MTDIQQRTLPGGSPAIAYDVGGDADARPLVLLHGLSANSTMSNLACSQRRATSW